MNFIRLNVPNAIIRPNRKVHTVVRMAWHDGEGLMMMISKHTWRHQKAESKDRRERERRRRLEKTQRQREERRRRIRRRLRLTSGKQSKPDGTPQGTTIITAIASSSNQITRCTNLDDGEEGHEGIPYWQCPSDEAG